MIGYDICPADDGILFADHAQLRRSGRVGNALVEYAPGKLLAFYPNCSGERAGGSSGYGWTEYRRSEDGGETWSDPSVLRFSVDAFLSGVYYVACEKAVSPAENVITAACLRCGCEPHWAPFLEGAAVISYDAGASWSDPVRISPYRGRVCDMKAADGRIWALYFCNDGKRGLCGSSPDHAYRLYASSDRGESWQEKSVLPLDASGRCGGALERTPQGDILALIYDGNDPRRPDALLSRDAGKTWETLEKPCLEKGIYEPQLLRAGGAYFLFGPGSDGHSDLPSGLVLYSSWDCLSWDEGRYIRVQAEGESEECPILANGVALDGAALLQYAQPYDGMRSNIYHTFIENIR